MTREILVIVVWRPLLWPPSQALYISILVQRADAGANADMGNGDGLLDEF